MSNRPGKSKSIRHPIKSKRAAWAVVGASADIPMLYCTVRCHTQNTSPKAFLWSKLKSSSTDIVIVTNVASKEKQKALPILAC